jgi:hypothetical protein
VALVDTTGQAEQGIDYASRRLSPAKNPTASCDMTISPLTTATLGESAPHDT